MAEARGGAARGGGAGDLVDEAGDPFRRGGLLVEPFEGVEQVAGTELRPQEREGVGTGDGVEAEVVAVASTAPRSDCTSPRGLFRARECVLIEVDSDRRRATARRAVPVADIATRCCSSWRLPAAVGMRVGSRTCHSCLTWRSLLQFDPELHKRQVEAEALEYSRLR